ncbi:MAG: hypothetical protein P8J33_10115 [Pirellulaceae bacterium]|nr:hypothetical protein [Pirellulaceae bacterium]
MKFVKMIIMCVVLFGGSAAISWFLRPATQETENDLPTGLESTQVAVETAPPTPLPSVDLQPSESLPTETVLRLKDSIMQKEVQLKQREMRLVEHEKRIKFMIDDMHRERTEMDEMLVEAEERAQVARGMLEKVQEQTSLLSLNDGGKNGGVADAGAGAAPMTETQRQNLANVGDFLSGLEPEQAASTIKEFCNNGKMDMVARLLSLMESRTVSKMLDALGDPALVAEILERIRELPPETE